MTLLAILIALTLGHFLRFLSRVRRTAWLRAYCRWPVRWLGAVPGLIALPLTLLPILAMLAIGHWWLTVHYGVLAWFAVAVLVLIFAWGPRDLDLDVEAYLSAANQAGRAAAARFLIPSGPLADVEADPASDTSAAAGDEQVDPERLSGAVFMCALERWFGVLLWFAIAGPVAALAYRLLCVLARADSGVCSIPDAWHRSARQLRSLMDWPAAQLMVLSLALVSHFDPVLAAWRDWYRQRKQDASEALEPGLNMGFLRVAGAKAVAVTDYEPQQQRDPVRIAMDLIWRTLFAWLTGLALLTLAGVAL